MTHYALLPASNEAGSAFTVRDVLTVFFRHQRLAAVCFSGIMAGTIAATFLMPAHYRATSKFLVQRERMDPIVSPEQNTQVPLPGEVTEEEMNSEVGLLQSTDVLRETVIACGLDKSAKNPLFHSGDPNVKIDKATAALASDLQVSVKKSNLIELGYASDNPELAARVLRAVGEAYIQKHVAVHTPPRQVQFFEQQTEHYKQSLANAETELKQFSEQQDGVSPQTARDSTLQKLIEFRSTLQQTRAAMAELEARIGTLEKQAGTTPERLVTSARQTDDAQVLQGLKNTLMSLELKRTELLTKYQPTYPLVQEVEKEIADTQSSIANEESKPLKEETTDRNPTYAWINEELAKAKSEYSGLQARATATERIIANYEAKARDLEQMGITERNLLRNVKTNEESYLLYLQKQEQAQMTQALDRTGIINVVVAEEPLVPKIPSNSRWLTLLVGTLFAMVVAFGAVWINEYLDPSFRTPREVALELSVPVLAAVPMILNGGRGSPNGTHTFPDWHISERSLVEQKED
jgi:uncharacterized protein involved in exopolysaccharide biosynthesis